MSEIIADEKGVLACPFCGGVYDRAYPLSTRIDCHVEAGGCGKAFRLSVYATKGGAPAGADGGAGDAD